MTRISLIFALAVSTSAVSKELSAPDNVQIKGKCHLRVDGKGYIRGPCDIELFGRNGERGFEIATPGTRKWVAVVGGGWGMWNKPVTAKLGQTVTGMDGKPADYTADEPLGKMRKEGDCWINRRARICARPMS